MAIRLIVSLRALPGKGAELAEAMLPLTREVQREPGCEQYEVFRSAEDPDKLVLLERWTDAASLEAHGAAMRARPPSRARELRDGTPVVERYDAE